MEAGLSTGTFVSRVYRPLENPSARYAPPKEIAYLQINREISKQLEQCFGKGFYSFKVEYKEGLVWDDQRGGPMLEIEGRLQLAVVQQLELKVYQPSFKHLARAELVQTAVSELQDRIRRRLWNWKWDFQAMISEFRLRYKILKPKLEKWFDTHNPF